MDGRVDLVSRRMEGGRVDRYTREGILPVYVERGTQYIVPREQGDPQIQVADLITTDLKSE